MKTIHQLLTLKRNPHYKFTPEEQALLDSFLFQQQAEQTSVKQNSKSSSKKTPVIVKANNVVAKQTGEIPTE